MATPSKIHLTSSQSTQFNLPGITDESAQKASQLLQENHEKHHIFFNEMGFHDHIVHHILTIFALRADPATLQKQYDVNASYQRRLSGLNASVVEELRDPEKFKKYLGKGKHYPNFLEFFRGEIERKGWQDVLNEYLFGGDERADDLLVRLYAGFLHPIIHLGFGIEFQQPAIIAEALAQTANHDNWMAPLFFDSEKAAKQNKYDGSKTMVQLLHEIHADKKLSGAAHFDDGNKIRDGIMVRAPEEMVKYASQYVVNESNLRERTAEMINANALFTTTSQRPPHAPKIDFFYMHCVTSSIFLPVFTAQPWLSVAHKIRLVEWMGRACLTLYASRGAPQLLVDEIKNHEITHAWEEIFEIVTGREDDGHLSKLVRALANGERVCAEFEDLGKREGDGDGDGFVVKGDMWVRAANLVLDSMHQGEEMWIRNAGMEEAWRDVPLREGARL